MQLVKYEAARRALSEACAVDEAKDIADKALALQQYAKQAQDKELEWHAAEIRIRAKRRIGELSAALEKSKPGPQDTSHGGEVTLKSTALKDAGISTSEAGRCEQIAKVPEKEFEAHIAAQRDKGEPVASAQVIKSVTQRNRRNERVSEIVAGNVPLAGGIGQFSILYADPPWLYEHVKTENRAIENQYPTMPLDEIKSLPVGDISAPDSALFLWATSPKLAEAMDVMSAWGFDYRTSAVWVKDKIGMGYYFRQRHEFLLVGTRGKLPTPEPSSRPDSVISAPRLEHSAKPIGVYDLLEQMYPEHRKIELFCRSPRNGWESWGNQSNAA